MNGRVAAIFSDGHFSPILFIYSSFIRCVLLLDDAKNPEGSINRGERLIPATKKSGGAALLKVGCMSVRTIPSLSLPQLILG